MFTFNGSTAKTVNITASSIGAAASSHTHSYLPLSGGTVTGDLAINGDLTTTQTYNGETGYEDTPLGISYSSIDGTETEGATSTYSTIFTVNKSSNRQFQFNLNNSGTIFAFRSAHVNNTDGTGTGWSVWRKIYHEGNKPTYSDVGAAAASHTHNYAGSSSAGGAANSVKTNLVVKLNGGSTEGTNLFTFNGSAAKTVNITPSGIGAAASSHEHNYLTMKGEGTITESDDTTANWGAQGNSVHWYPDSSTLTDKPSAWGFLCNITKNSSEVHQLWMTQASGSIYHRGGNSSGWSGTWKEILDSSNFGSYALPLTGGGLSGRLGAWGKLSLPTTGNQWISGMDITAPSIGITTQQTTGSYHPVLGVMTSSGNYVNLGGIGDNFGFYGYDSGRTENGIDWNFSFDTANKAINIWGIGNVYGNGATWYLGNAVLNNNQSLYGQDTVGTGKYNICGIDSNNYVYLGWGAETRTLHRNPTYLYNTYMVMTRPDSSFSTVFDMYTNPNRLEIFWGDGNGDNWVWDNKFYFDVNGQFYASKQVSIGGHRITPYSENGVSIINPAGSEFSGLEVKELWIGPYSGATYKFVVSPSEPTASWGTVWVQI